VLDDTPVRLSKEDSRKRWQEIRDLWCRFDPIGVMPMPDWPRDEYDAYLGPTLRLLESGAPQPKIEAYLAQVTLEHMGLNETPAAKLARINFAAELRAWYADRWPGTVV
jgi:hypothetical protein